MKEIEELLNEYRQALNKYIYVCDHDMPFIVDFGKEVDLVEAEILRRFAELERENENLKCCGNCGLSRYDNDYGLSCSYKFKKVKPNDRYCDNWQSDKE